MANSLLTKEPSKENLVQQRGILVSHEHEDQIRISLLWIPISNIRKAKKYAAHYLMDKYGLDKKNLKMHYFARNCPIPQGDNVEYIIPSDELE